MLALLKNGPCNIVDCSTFTVAEKRADRRSAMQADSANRGNTLSTERSVNKGYDKQ